MRKQVRPKTNSAAAVTNVSRAGTPASVKATKPIDALEKLKQKGEIVVATTGTYPPYSFQDKDGLTGFDIDISNEIGKRIGINIKFAVVEFVYRSVPVFQFDFDYVGGKPGHHALRGSERKENERYG
ncbi:transporter substrate-binding domain-containing protein [Paenibacillus chartarius]|uniref:Transporter substrate-binding domain-containing protein n=1 Tax=Paenibacillus chartarius TaxID=747481 RepID=A0ABV6DUB0_9BACL